MNVISESGMFVTKFYIEFKDCNDKLVFKSVTGSSRNKDRQAANTEALEEALLSVKDLNYKFEGNSTESVIESTEVIQSVPVVKSVVVSENALFAQPIENGFQLVDKTPKVVLKMFKTTEKDYFIATSESKNGVLFKKNNEWFFEYYLNEKLVSEKLSIKF
jgi:hypothetical protein